MGLLATKHGTKLFQMDSLNSWFVGCGGGGGSAGAILAHVNPKVSLDFNPKKPKRSEIISEAYKMNFPSSDYYFTTIETFVKEKLFQTYSPPDFLCSTLPCTNYSIIGGRGQESLSDITSIEALCSLIREVSPRNFWAENTSYWKSGNGKGFRMLTNTLKKQFKYVDADVHCASNFGVPQRRKRVILRASNKRLISLKQKYLPKVSWYDALKDRTLMNKDFIALEEHVRVSGFNGKKRRKIGRKEQVWTLTAAIFTDGTNSTRTKVVRAWVKNPDVWGAEYVFLAPEDFKILAGFPDFYKLPKKLWGVIFGLSIPPLMAKEIFQSFNTD